MSMPRRKLKRNHRKKRAKVNKTQRQALISTMEKRNLFARKQISKLGARGYLKWQAMWKDLAKLLNKMGPCCKSWKQWEEFWTALRRSSRIKTTRYVNERKRTGHKRPKTTITEEEERVTKIFGKPGLGLAVYRESGVKYTRKLDETQIAPGGLGIPNPEHAMTFESSLVNYAVHTTSSKIAKETHKKAVVSECTKPIQARSDLANRALQNAPQRRRQMAMLQRDVESLYDSLCDVHVSIDNCIDTEILEMISTSHQ